MVGESGDDVSAESVSQQLPPSPSPQMFSSSTTSASSITGPQRFAPLPQLFGSSSLGAKVQEKLVLQSSPQSFGFAAASTLQQQPPPPSSRMFGSSEASATQQQQLSLQEPILLADSCALPQQQQPTPSLQPMSGFSAKSASRQRGRFTGLTQPLSMSLQASSLSQKDFRRTPPPSRRGGLFGSVQVKTYQLQKSKMLC